MRIDVDRLTVSSEARHQRHHARVDPEAVADPEHATRNIGFDHDPISRVVRPRRRQ
jgi:hypothetical protein